MSTHNNQPTVVFGKVPNEKTVDDEIVYNKQASVNNQRRNKSTSNDKRPFKMKNKVFPSEKRKSLSANDARNFMKASKNPHPSVEPSSKKKKFTSTNQQIYTFQERLTAGRLRVDHGATDAGELFRFVVSMTGHELCGRISEDRNMSLIVSAVALSRVT